MRRKTRNLKVDELKQYDTYYQRVYAQIYFIECDELPKKEEIQEDIKSFVDYLFEIRFDATKRDVMYKRFEELKSVDEISIEINRSVPYVTNALLNDMNELQWRFWDSDNRCFVSNVDNQSSIKMLCLQLNVTKRLLERGINTIEQLHNTTDAELMTIRGIKQAGIVNIRRNLVIFEKRFVNIEQV